MRNYFGHSSTGEESEKKILRLVKVYWATRKKKKKMATRHKIKGTKVPMKRYQR